jgi:hypothetical protein
MMSLDIIQVSDRGVAVQNLLEEEIGGDHGGEGALPEGVPEVAADLSGQRLGNRIGEVALEAAQGLGIVSMVASWG